MANTAESGSHDIPELDINGDSLIELPSLGKEERREVITRILKNPSKQKAEADGNSHDNFAAFVAGLGQSNGELAIESLQQTPSFKRRGGIGKRNKRPEILNPMERLQEVGILKGPDQDNKQENEVHTPVDLPQTIELPQVPMMDLDIDAEGYEKTIPAQPGRVKNIKGAAEQDEPVETDRITRMYTREETAILTVTDNAAPETRKDAQKKIEKLKEGTRMLKKPGSTRDFVAPLRSWSALVDDYNIEKVLVGEESYVEKVLEKRIAQFIELSKNEVLKEIALIAQEHEVNISTQVLEGLSHMQGTQPLAFIQTLLEQIIEQNSKNAEAVMQLQEVLKHLEALMLVLRVTNDLETFKEQIKNNAKKLLATLKEQSGINSIDEFEIITPVITGDLDLSRKDVESQLEPNEHLTEEKIEAISSVLELFNDLVATIPQFIQAFIAQSFKEKKDRINLSKQLQELKRQYAKTQEGKDIIAGLVHIFYSVLNWNPENEKHIKMFTKRVETEMGQIGIKDMRKFLIDNIGVERGNAHKDKAVFMTRDPFITKIDAVLSSDAYTSIPAPIIKAAHDIAEKGASLQDAIKVS